MRLMRRAVEKKERDGPCRQTMSAPRWSKALSYAPLKVEKLEGTTSAWGGRVERKGPMKRLDRPQAKEPTTSERQRVS